MTRMLGVIVRYSASTKEFYHLIPYINIPQTISSKSRILSVYKSTLVVFSLECMQGSGCLHTLFCQCVWNKKNTFSETIFKCLNAVTIVPCKVQVIICILGCWPVDVTRFNISICIQYEYVYFIFEQCKKFMYYSVQRQNENLQIHATWLPESKIESETIQQLWV